MAERWVQPVLTGRDYGSKVEKKALSSKSDDFGNKVRADIYTNYSPDPNAYPTARMWREDRQGNVIGDVLLMEMPIPEGDSIIVRLDDATLMIAGHNAHLLMSGHGETVGGGRNQYDFEYVALDWWNIGGAPGEHEGAATFIPTGGNGGSDVQVDYERIQAMINAAMHTTVDNILPKTKLAIEQEGVMTLGNVYHSDGLYQRFKDTTKEECTKALADYHVAREPHNPDVTATEGPKP